MEHFGSYSVNWLAILVATAANMLIGMVWYNMKVFGAAWSRLAKVDMSDKSGAGRAMAIGLAVAFIQASFLAYTFDLLGVTTAGEGVISAVMIWFGFIASFAMLDVGYERQPIRLYWIKTGFQLAFFVVAGAIIGGWQ